MVAFQIAIGLAVLVNAVYIVKQRVDKIGRPTGMDTANMIFVASAGFAQDFDYDASWREDIATIRGLPGVKAACITSKIPLSGGGSSSGFQAKPGEATPEESVPATPIVVDEQGVAALGITLSRAARSKRMRSCRPRRPSSSRRRRSSRKPSRRRCSRRSQSARQDFYDGLSNPVTIVGVIEHMHGAWVGWDKLDHVVLFPRIKSGPTRSISSGRSRAAGTP